MGNRRSRDSQRNVRKGNRKGSLRDDRKGRQSGGRKNVQKGGKRDARKKMSPMERKLQKHRRRRKRIMILITELFILTGLCVAAYALLKLDKLNIHILDQDKLEVYKDTGPYTNIALFGLDSREGELEGGVQSDTIMIASINNETNDVKILSVYRDTLLQQADGDYGKANSAYNSGGPEEAISLLNRNFDLDIRNYVSVNFSALVDVIDALGGLDIDMTQEEAFYCNGYASETARVVGQDMIPIREEAGVQHLDGVHAVSYARIRYTEGNDFKRAERQRQVLQMTADKAKKANLLTLNQIVNDVFPKISTSLTIKDMLGFAANILDYNIVGTEGFPYAVTTDDDVRNHKGSFVVPIGFKENVTQLHQKLFGEDYYEPSKKVQQIHDDIIYLTGVGENATAMETTFEGDIR